ESLLATEPASVPARRALMTALGKLGKVGLRNNDLAAATPLYQKAMELAQALEKDNPDRLQAQADLAICHTLRGNLAMRRKDSQAALAAYRTASDLRAAVVAAKPNDRVAKEDLAIAYEKLGDVAFVLLDIPLLDAWNKGLELRKELAAAQPERRKARRLL